MFGCILLCLRQVFVLGGTCRMISSPYAIPVHVFGHSDWSCCGGEEGCEKRAARWLWVLSAGAACRAPFLALSVSLCALQPFNQQQCWFDSRLVSVQLLLSQFSPASFRGPAAGSAQFVCLSRAASNLYHSCELWLCGLGSGCRVCLEGGPHHPACIQGFLRGVLLRL